VAEQQNSDCLSIQAGDQSPFDRLLGNHPHGLATSGADHRDDALFLAIVEQYNCAGTLLVVEGASQSALLKPMANLPDRLG